MYRNCRRKCFKLELGKDFLAKIQTAQIITAKKDKLDLIKIKNICALRPATQLKNWVKA